MVHVRERLRLVLRGALVPLRIPIQMGDACPTPRPPGHPAMTRISTQATINAMEVVDVRVAQSYAIPPTHALWGRPTDLIASTSHRLAMPAVTEIHVPLAIPVMHREAVLVHLIVAALESAKSALPAMVQVAVLARKLLAGLHVMTATLQPRMTNVIHP